MEDLFFRKRNQNNKNKYNRLINFNEKTQYFTEYVIGYS